METKILTKQAANFTANFTVTDDLLVRIHTATGWRLPKSEKHCIILCRQLQKKLFYDYPGITHDQVETAFMQFGTEENFTGSMSIAGIDKVLKHYFSHNAQNNFEQERKQYSQTIAEPTPHQHLHECRELIEHKYQLYLEEKLNVELLPAFIFPTLVKDYDVDPELPLQFISEAKEFIAETNGKRRIGRATAISEVLSRNEPHTLENTCIKLAIEFCFKFLKEHNYEHLYTKEELCF